MRKYSANNEEIIISNLIALIKNPIKLCVDIGAGNLEDGSNTRLLINNGFKGILIECENDRSSKALDNAHLNKLDVDLYNTLVTQANVNLLINASDAANGIGVLSIDIDSVDYYILNAILNFSHPQIICIEINERIPPGIDYIFPENLSGIAKDATLISSAGISNYEKLLHRFNYSLVCLEFNNLIAISNTIEVNKNSESDNIIDIRNCSAEQLWYNGFYKREGWRETMPWNIPFEPIWNAPSELRAKLLNEYFNHGFGLELDFKNFK